MGSAIRFGSIRPRRSQRRSAMYRLTITLCLVLCGIVLLAGLAACAPAQGTTSTPGATSGSINHLHDVLPLRGVGAGGIVLAATHLGLYRTTDHGQTWR